MTPEELSSHYEFVNKFSRSLILNVHDAEDIVQNAWISILEKSSLDVDKPKSWFTGVIRNMMRMFYRTEGRRRKYELGMEATEAAPSVSDKVEKNDLLQHVMSSVVNLDEPYRSTLLMYYYDGLSNKEAAHKLGVPVETMRTRLKRGLEQVRLDLDKKHKGDRKKWMMALAPFAGLKLTAKEREIPSAPAVAHSKGTQGFGYLKTGLSAGLLIGSVIIMIMILNQKDEDQASASTQPVANTEKANGVDLTLDKGPTTRTTETRNLAPKTRLMNLTGAVLVRADKKASVGTRVSMAQVPKDSHGERWSCFTDAEGRFDLNLPLSADTPPKGVDLVIAAEGCRPVTTYIPLNEKSKTQDLGAYYVDKNTTQVITILDQNRQPVSNARVELYLSFHNTIIAEKVTDQEGKISISSEEMLVRNTHHHNLTLRVCAEKMRDYLYSPKAKFNLQKELVLSPEENWTGTVVDASTQAPVPGAHLSILFRGHAVKWNPDILEKYHVRSDQNGHFSMPCFTHDGKNNIWILCVCAPGYESWVSEEGIFPHSVQLKKTNHTPRNLVGRAIDADTGEPIPCLRFRTFLTYNVPYIHQCSDQNGFFELLDMASIGDIQRLWLYAPDTQQKAHYSIKGVGTREDPLLFPFKKLLFEKFYVHVRDELGDPVPNTHVEITTRNNHKIITATDHEGVVVFYPQFTEPSSVILKAYHARYYCAETPKDILLDEKTAALTLTMQKGTLFQNLRVLDETGANAKPTDIVAEIMLKKGTSKIRAHFKNQFNGSCDLALQRFIEGEIFLKDRPDIRASISYQEHLVNQKEVVLQISSVIKQSNEILITLENTYGDPLKGVVMQVYMEKKGPRSSKWVRTDDQGKHRHAARLGSSYNLVTWPFFYEKGDKKWYTMNQETGIKPGSSNYYIMDAWDTGIKVNIEAVLKKYPQAAYKFIKYFETPEGQVIQADFQINTAKVIIFFGLPEKKMRAVFIGKNNELFKSPFFELKKHHPNKTKVEALLK